MLFSVQSLRVSFRVLAGVVGIGLVVASAVTARGEDAVRQSAGSTQPAPADKPSDAAAMPGCAADGSCCGACQQKAPDTQPDEQAAGGCPFQRAKKAQQGS